jgi:hypothetical protein
MAILVLVGYVLLFAMGLLILVDAYKTGGALPLVLALIIPLYSLYWLFFRMEKGKGSAITCWIVGTLLVLSPTIQAKLTGGGESIAPEAYQYHASSGLRYRKTANPKQSLIVVLVTCEAGHLKEIAEGSDDFEIHEVGDEAVYTQGWLVARKGSKCYIMGVEGMRSGDTLDGRKNLMRLVIASVK